MRTKTFLPVVCAFSIAALALANGLNWPVTCAPDDATPASGSTVTFTVTFNRTRTTSTVTTITVSNSSAFTSIPSTVTLPANQTQVSFQGTLASGFTGLVTVETTANGQGTSTTLDVE